MRTSKYLSKLKADEMGGAVSINPSSEALPDSPQEAGEDSEAIDSVEDDSDLYAQPVPVIPHRSHSTRAANNRFKAKQMAEERLIHVSDELHKLAEEIRYLNPLMAEVLDDAWDATEEAIEFLSTEATW